LLVCCSLIFGFAEMRLIEEVKMKAKHFNYIGSTFCIDGYKFVMFMGNTGKSMVQFFEKKGEVASVPAKC